MYVDSHVCGQRKYLSECNVTGTAARTSRLLPVRVLLPLLFCFIKPIH